MKTQISKPNIEENQKESLSEEEGRGEKFSEKLRTSGLTWSRQDVHDRATRPRSGERKPHLKLNPAVLGERGNALGASTLNNGR